MIVKYGAILKSQPCRVMRPFFLQNDSEIPPNLRASYGDKGQNLLGALGVDVLDESEEGGVRRKKKKKKKVSRGLFRHLLPSLVSRGI